ncbi:MAG: hypothetical protein WCI92_10580 [Bacteroidota bacterium]
MKLRKFIPEFIVLVYVILFLFTKNPSSPWDRVIVSDGKGYYSYLPAMFIYHDLDYGFINQYETEYYPASRQLYKDFRYDTGNGIVNKYFPGPALLWLPFFGIAHLIAVIFGYAADGYSQPYQLAIAFAAFFYFWLSLLILRRILRFYTENENTIAWLLIATALATNLIYYTVNAGCQVHVYDFFLVNAFIFFVLSACKHGKTAHFVSAAVALGLVIISRPQNGLIVLALPFICGSRESFILFFRKAVTNPQVLLTSALALMVTLLIPVIFWYAKTGHFLVYSYGSETYDLTKPHLFRFLFSFEKGWLLYTPVALFATLGLIFLFRKSKWQFISLTAFLFFLVYFLSSWWVWNYTSYISQRVMIDYYAFVAILLVYIFQWVEKKWNKFILPLILSGFIFLNLLQYFQQLIWVYPAGPVTAKSYFSNFFSFSKGSTFMIPENEIVKKQSYITDFESYKPLFLTGGFEFSKISYSGKNSLVLDSASNGKQLFIRGMAGYKDVRPVILRISGWYNAEILDSTLTVEVNIGTIKNKYSSARHNLMSGLKAGRWKYAEMAVYLPYFRSVSDSIFISFQNLSKGKVLLDDLQIDFLKMQETSHHDWILAAEDKVDSARLFHTDLEKPLETPWGNQATVTNQKAFSGQKSSCINSVSPYSVVFEKELEPGGKTDCYFRVGSRISGADDSEVLLVFDFTSKGKQVFYKTYPIRTKGSNGEWTVSEVFREFPVARLKADKVKIYYWFIKGNTHAYMDDIQVDIVYYKPILLIPEAPFPGSNNSENLEMACSDFEKRSSPESGFITEVQDAFSGRNVCTINTEHPYSFTHLLPLKSVNNYTDAFVNITAKVNSDQYTSAATLVADFRQGGKSVSYNPFYLKGQTAKGQWNKIDFGLAVPAGITANDSVLVYFYLAETDEVLMIDDFCVSVKRPKNK